MDEIVIQRALSDCPSVPKIIRVYESSSEIKILMEFIDGDNLSALIKNGPAPPQ
jgi:serine/threonine protein kinase